MLERCLLFSLGIAAILFANADGLGNTVYHNAETGYFIRIYAPLVPVMYMDMVTDGCLRGLGEHLWTMIVNIADSAVSVLLVILLVPKYALTGYVVILWVTEVFNFVLSICRLRRVAEARISLRSMGVPLLCGIGTSSVTSLLQRWLSLPAEGVLSCGCGSRFQPHCTAGCSCSVGNYIRNACAFCAASVNKRKSDPGRNVPDRFYV